MNNLIYYPTFEIRDQKWLKFAILYLRNLNMIIPESGERYLSSEFHDIYNSTDLFRIHKPDYHEGYNASLDAIENIEPILQNPQYYSRRFNITSRSETIIDKWSNEQNHTFEVFQEKYSHEFVHFCIRNRLGHYSRHGMLLPQELAHIYMALLAKSIGDSKRLSPITDISRYDYLSNVLGQPNLDEDKISLAQNVINVFLPRNLNKLSVESLLNLRISRNFDIKLTAFQNAINDFHSKIENGNITAEFIHEYENPFRELTEEIKSLSLDLAKYGLGTWMIFNTSNPEIPNFVKEVIIGGLTIYTGRKIKVKSTWQHTKNRVLVRRYLTGIKKYYAPQLSKLPCQH